MYLTAEKQTDENGINEKRPLESLDNIEAEIKDTIKSEP